MLRYDPNTPIEPFYVPAKVLKCSADASPETPGGGGKPVPRHDLGFAQLGTVQGKTVGAIVLAAAYFASEQNPAVGAITVLLLLGAVLFRLDPRRRRIALAPLVLSTFRLATQINLSYATANARSFVRQAIPNVPLWLPLFLAACLFFGPSFRTTTETITFAYSFLLLMSGLLPGDGYIVVLVMLEYTLFVAITIGLVVDLISTKQRQPARA
jgi:hypothetical protein